MNIPEPSNDWTDNLPKDTDSPEGFVRCWYSCHACGLRYEPVIVRERKDSEDISYWVKKVLCKAVEDSHTVKSLLCSCRKVDLLLHMHETATQIGKRATA